VEGGNVRDDISGSWDLRTRVGGRGHLGTTKYGVLDLEFGYKGIYELCTPSPKTLRSLFTL
jgi:hypothetical protein